MQWIAFAMGRPQATAAVVVTVAIVYSPAENLAVMPVVVTFL